MTKKIYQEDKEKMEQAMQALVRRYIKLRGGRARAELVTDIKVDCYDAKMSIAQLANISTPDPHLIVIEPWDKSLIKNIEKAILVSDLGINPTDDGNVIRLSIPPLSEERRDKMAKILREWAEESRVSVRNSRREAREKLEKLEKEKEISEDERRKVEKDIQSLTDEFISKIDEIQNRKIKEIRKV